MDNKTNHKKQNDIDNKIKHRKQLHLKDFDYKGSDKIFFITICTADKQNYFWDSRIVKIIKEELEFRKIAKEIRLYCYCIMPDHLHILFSFTDSYQNSLQNWVSAFKRYTARSIRKSFGIKQLWQRNFYDHIIRKEESLLKIAEYIVNNPVRKGIVKDWKDYPHSKIVDPFPL